MLTATMKPDKEPIFWIKAYTIPGTIIAAGLLAMGITQVIDLIFWLL
jgi:hypothetical protein